MEIVLDVPINTQEINVTHIIIYVDNNENAVVCNNEDGSGVSIPFENLSAETVALRESFLTSLSADIKTEYEKV